MRKFRFLITIGLAAAGAGYYLHREGPDAVRTQAMAWLTQARSLATDAHQTPNDTANALTPAKGTDRIQVYFAPCEALHPMGIDDRLTGFMKGAKQSIDCAFYDLQLAEAAETLIAKHRAGVPVRLVTDSHYEGRKALLACIEAGIPVTFDKRSPFMHNKFCIVDGQAVWTGSMNVTHNGAYRNDNNALLIASPELAANYASEFLEMFDKKKFGGRSPQNTPLPVVQLDGVTIECYFAPEDGVEREILEEIAEADTGIDFMAFSFTSKPIAEAMAARIQQGVSVRGVFEKRGAGSKYSRDDYLADQGAQVYLDQNKYTMHHKVIIIDGKTVITGSYNFSQSAEKKNDENVLILHSSDIARQYAHEFERLIAPTP